MIHQFSLRPALSVVASALILGVVSLRAAGSPQGDDAPAPHTPTLLYYLTGATTAQDRAAIQGSLAKLKSVRKVNVDTTRSSVQVRFDSHVISYHQAAQAIAEAGASLGKAYDPRLKITVPEYSANAAKVDRLFAGKRLNQRVKIQTLDKTKGVFLLHFLPLTLDPSDAKPQGFNGGHLHHPLHDPPPRGLGLTCTYASEDNAERSGAPSP